MGNTARSDRFSGFVRFRRVTKRGASTTTTLLEVSIAAIGVFGGIAAIVWMAVR